MSSNSKNLSDIWKMKRRGKRDSDRHKKLVEDAIRKNGKDLITEHNIITSDGDKKIKIPIRFLDQYKFKYGKLNDNKSTGQGLSDKPGTRYRMGKKPSKSKPNGPGNEKAERFFEAEITVDELVDILLDELDLPWMEPKSASAVEVESEELSSIEKKGIRPNIDLKRTLIENLKRNAMAGDAKISNIVNEDLRYKSWDSEIEFHSNAAIYLMMDRSASMDEFKRYIAKSFYFWMVQFLKKRYKNIKLVFIAHDVEAFVVSEKEFFTISSGGGTACSSAFKLAYEHIKRHHPVSAWNNYVFEFSDGDNWPNDNKLCLEYVSKLLPLVTAMGYGEILNKEAIPWMDDERLLSNTFAKNIKRTRFVSLQLTSKEDVFEALKEFFNVKNRPQKFNIGK
tara:strand:- start:9618 stop:10799 length:1182 start_codon:yes stop_codon:yes gene_type:complete